MGAFEFIFLVVSGEVLLEAIVICERLMADFALASHCMLFMVVVFESCSSGEVFAAFGVITDKLMILGEKLLTSFALHRFINLINLHQSLSQVTLKGFSRCLCLRMSSKIRCY